MKSSVGSSPGSRGLLGTTRWPCCLEVLQERTANFPGMHLSYYSLHLFEDGVDEAPKPWRDESANDVGRGPCHRALSASCPAAALERAIEQRALVDFLEDLSDGVFRGVAVDAACANLLDHARAAAVLDRAFHPRAPRARRDDHSACRRPSNAKRPPRWTGHRTACVPGARAIAFLIARALKAGQRDQVRVH